MLIELADDLATGLNGDEVAAIDLLLHSRRLGNHLLVGTAAVFDALLDLDLSARGKAILKRVKQRQIQKHELRQAVTFHVRVSCNTEPGIAETVDGTVINLRLSDFQSFGPMSAAVVLGENLRDARLGEVMARHYARATGMSRVKLNGRCLGGGGDTTAETFRELRDEGHLCLCIVDSDRKSPSDGMGPTARKVLGEVDGTKPWGCVLVTRCREAENQLSARLIEKGVEGDGAYIGMIPSLEKLDAGGAVVELREYCDFKNGTSLEWIFSLPEGPVRDFWRSNIGRIAMLPLVRESCVDRHRCLDQDECKCWLVPKFGEGILERCLNAMKKMSTQKIAESVCAVTSPHWKYVGSAVFSWTCGSEKVVA